MDGEGTWVNIADAAGRMGVTPEAVRKRIGRGTIPATKRDGRWYVSMDGVPDASYPAGGPPSSPNTGGQPVLDGVQPVQDARDAHIRTLQSELSIKNRQIEELLIVVRQTQAMLPAPQEESRSWWRFCHRGSGV